jgi:hypothetical protein
MPSERRVLRCAVYTRFAHSAAVHRHLAKGLLAAYAV